MSNLKKITVNVFNTDYNSPKHYIHSFEMPKYKQFKRTIIFLKEYIKAQKSNDFNNLSIRFYVFQANEFLLKENEILEMYK
jgi:hypothetical protein